MNSATKPSKGSCALHGVILIDKPAGITSAEVVRRIKRLVKPLRVGHLGTLDPFATGLLPILVGEGCKLAPFLEGGEKEYHGTIRLGAETDTLDPTGEIMRQAPVPEISPPWLHEIAAKFCGESEQVPPIFSAIKRDGVRMYKLAREDASVEAPPPRRVTISRFELSGPFDGPGGDHAELQFEVICSPGTYVRSLARDVAVAMGTVGYLGSLRRIRSSGFHLGDARVLDEVLAALESGTLPHFVGLNDALPTVTELQVDNAAAERIRHGDSGILMRLAPLRAGLFKLVSGGTLVAVAERPNLAPPRLLRVFAANQAGEQLY